MDFNRNFIEACKIEQREIITMKNEFLLSGSITKFLNVIERKIIAKRGVKDQYSIGDDVINFAIDEFQKSAPMR